MTPGDLYTARVAFSDGSGSKIRPVVVLRVRADGKVIALHSTSKVKPGLHLLLKITFGPISYVYAWKSGCNATSYFYSSNLCLLDSKDFRKSLGSLKNVDFVQIKSGLKELFEA